MDEVLSILIALGALIAGILAIGWAAGDWRPRSGSPPPQAGQEQNPAPSS